MEARFEMLLEAFIINNRESVFQKITCEKAVRAEKKSEALYHK